MRFCLLLLAACSAFAQAPAFEVASIKRSEPLTPELVQSGRVHIGVSLDNRSVRIGQLTLAELVTIAYQLKPYQLSAPQWTSTVRFDVQAKLPDGATRGQVPAMMQTLLAERFGLKIHREQRELSALALVQTKDGQKLKPSPADAEPKPASPQIRGGTNVGSDGSQVHSGPDGESRITRRPDGGEHAEVKKMTMAAFAGFLYRFCDRPVFDLTGVTGRYDAEFDISREEIRNAARSHGYAIKTDAETSDPTGPTLKASLETLGLRLEGRKLPIEVVVVDAAEKVPTEN